MMTFQEYRLAMDFDPEDELLRMMRSLCNEKNNSALQDPKQNYRIRVNENSDAYDMF